MSYMKSSALRWFEALLEDARHRVRTVSKKLSTRRVLENLVNLGDIVFPKVIYISGRLAEVIGKLQITMIESMITTSIWYGLALVLLVTITILMTW